MESSQDDREKMLSELIKRRTVSRDSRNDRTLINYLKDQKYDEVFAEQPKKPDNGTSS